MSETDAGDNGVFAARKQKEHGAGVVCVRWFFENVVIDGDGGVGAQHDFIGALPGGFGFGVRQATDVVDGGFVRSTEFFNRFCANGETESRNLQQLAPAGRLRC
jgi:hypothetical protein